MLHSKVHAARAAADFSRSLSSSHGPQRELFDAMVTTLRAAGCVFAEDEAELILNAASGSAEPDMQRLLIDATARRSAGEPLEYVVGWARFCGLRLAVASGVFIPRRRSEFLAELALLHGRDAAVVVELCCGVAPLATALAVGLPQTEIHAADIDPVQTEYARRNLALFADRARVHDGDLYTALPDELRGHVDLIVANAPYVPSGAIATLPTEAREYEPLHMLDGGSDGLAVQRGIAAGAAEWLAPGGHILVETSAHQSEGSRALFAEAGLDAWLARCEDLEATVVIGRRLCLTDSSPINYEMAEVCDLD